MYFWAKKACVRLHIFQVGKSMNNAFVEIFNGRIRAYYLDLHWFVSVEDARLTIKNRRHHFNYVRPQRSLGKKPSAVFAKKQPNMLNFPLDAMLEHMGTVNARIRISRQGSE